MKRFPVYIVAIKLWPDGEWQPAYNGQEPGEYKGFLDIDLAESERAHVYSRLVRGWPHLDIKLLTCGEYVCADPGEGDEMQIGDVSISCKSWDSSWFEGVPDGVLAFRGPALNATPARGAGDQEGER